jgi:TonB-dependent SusC/RagA subfamily outer membrane receptor
MGAFSRGSGGPRWPCAFLVGTLLLPRVATPARAQQPESGELSGRVTYAGNGQGVRGALLTLREVGLGVLTDAEGRYRLQGVPAGRHVAVTALMGCILSTHAVEMASGSRVSLDVALDPPVFDIEGILVTASTSGVARAEVPFSVARLDAREREIVTGSTRSVGSMLQGTLAGVRVVQGSGEPGNEPSILLRAPTSLVGSQGPLVVIDGVITEGRLTDIDPLDVQRVEVLKGAAAAASYGSRGQGGVIEITTKRGPSAPLTRSFRPVLLVDGVVTDGTLADVNLSEVADIRRLEGPVAAVLYGVGAEAGAIEVTTIFGPPPGARALQPACLDPGL